MKKNIERSFNWRVILMLLCLSSILVLTAPSTVWAQTVNDNSLVEGESKKIVLDNPNPLSSFLQDILATINPIIDQTKDVIENLNGGSLENAILSTLGSIGLIDPHEEAASVSTSNQSPYSNPQSPEEVAQKAEAADAAQSQISDRLSQIVFGKKGQEAIAEQNKVLVKTQETAAQAEAATGLVYEAARDIAVGNYQNAAIIQQQAEIAQSSNASQDVLKALAAQNKYIADINVGISEQLALLGSAQVYNGMQMKGLNTQLTIANQRQQNMETFLASGNSQLAEIDSNIELQIKREIEREARERLRSQQGMTRIFIPGLFENDQSQDNQNQDDQKPDYLDSVTISQKNSFFRDNLADLNE
ncbi:MAG: hypothetical protein WBM44_27895 [Waterburya sp.]